MPPATQDEGMSSTQAEAPFHAGEIAVQERSGAREIAAQVGRIIRDAMPDQHRLFFAELPYVVLGALDDAGYPRASFVAKAPGFVSTPDPRTLVVGALPVPGDPALPGLGAGSPVAVLGIQLHTRRRNRENGLVLDRSEETLTIGIEQSFGNCPKYIVPRSVIGPRTRERGAVTALGSGLSDEAERIIRAADTAFIASARPRSEGGSLDVSHRGGEPGFVHVERTDRGTRLVMPDYSGNYLFMTLGNLYENPRAGLLLLDFERGDALSIAAEARILWNDAREAETWGAERRIELDVVGGILLPGAVPFTWTTPTSSRSRPRS